MSAVEYLIRNKNYDEEHYFPDIVSQEMHQKFIKLVHYDKSQGRYMVMHVQEQVRFAVSKSWREVRQ